MSEFAGLFHLDGAPAAGGDLARLGDGLAAAGCGDPQLWSDGPVGLVWRKAAYTPEDLAERQPLAGAGRMLVADGRLDGRADLAASLGLSPHGVPDSALMLAALARFGDGAWGRLTGDFAAAVWQPESRRLSLVRDAMGLRPLYYALAGDRTLAFATRLPALLRLPWLSRDLDEATLVAWLACHPGDAVRTCWRAIRRVPLGHVLTFGPGRPVEARRHWTPSPVLPAMSDGEVLEAARTLIDQAVADRLRTVGIVGATLSGGLDSPGVAATAARLLAPARLPAFTRLPGPGAPALPAGPAATDDPAMAALVAAHCPGIDWRTVSGTSTLADRFSVTGQLQISPLGTAWFAPVFRSAHDAGVRALLSGEYGNLGLSFRGYGQLRIWLIRGQWRRLAVNLSELARIQGRRGHGIGLLRDELLMPVLARLRHRLRPPGPDHWRDVAAIRDGYLERHALLDALRDVRTGVDGRDLLDTAAWRRWALLESSDTCDSYADDRAVHGLDHRHPLGDRRLAEFCLALPLDQFYRDGWTRALARRVLSDRIPAPLLKNDAPGAQTPDWFATVDADRARMRDDLDWVRTAPFGGALLDGPRLDALLAAWPADAVDAHRRMRDYRFLLPRAIHLIRFLRWAERQ